MGAVRAGVAGLPLGELRGIETIEGHPQCFGAIADQGAQWVDGVPAAIRIGQRLVGGHHGRGALPDQYTNAARAGGAFQHRGKASPDGYLSERLSQCSGIQEDEQNESGRAESGPRSCPSAVVAGTHPGQEKQNKYVGSTGEAEPGSTALGPENGEQLNDKDKKIGAAGQNAGQAVVGGRGLEIFLRRSIAIRLNRVFKEVGETGEGAFQRQEKGHNQMCSEEDGIAGGGGYAGADILSPGQGIFAKVLEDAVDGDGQAGDDYCMLEAPQLCGLS